MNSIGTRNKPSIATPSSLAVPDRIETRLGTLKFFDGFPNDETVQRLYDNLDLQRAVRAFLTAMPAASLSAMREGLRSIGVTNTTVAIFETRMDSRSLFLNGNTESIYTLGWLDLAEGPLVLETPANVLGLIDDFWSRYVCDIGNAGPDEGEGGKFLLLPPAYRNLVIAPKSAVFSGPDDAGRAEISATSADGQFTITHQFKSTPAVLAASDYPALVAIESTLRNKSSRLLLLKHD